MKNNSNFYLLITLIINLLCCWNGSLVESDGKDKRPDVNFYGTLEDHHAKFDFVDLLIGRKYEGIVVYQPITSRKKRVAGEVEIKEQEIDPRQNKSLLDLQEVRYIELKHPDHPTASKIEINNKNFVEIVVTSINGTKRDYLVESNRKITCRTLDKGPSGDKQTVYEERELNMIHIKKLTIKGYKSVKEEPVKRYYEKEDVNVKHEEAKPAEHKKEVDKKTSDEKNEIAKNTENILNNLEESVQKLSVESPSTFDKIKSSILSMLKSLREQLQKMLDMLQ